MKILAKKSLWALLSLCSILTGLLIFTKVNAQTNSMSYSDSGVPVILPRSTWDNDPSLNVLMTWLPQNINFPSDWQPVERIVIHDTGCDPTTNPTCNNNTNPIPTIQAIYRYHAVTRGWGDIGYNYIIDQQGRIYEGRYGGNGSRGAHTYYDRAYDNFNYGSIGIVIFGNYSNVPPPPAVYESLSRLVGWLCTLNGLNPQEQKSSYIWNASKGGFKTFYSGLVVIGHKDIEPGNPDPGMVDLNKVRSEAVTFSLKFKDYIYQKNDGSAKIYKVTSGTRQTFVDLANYTAQNNSFSKICAIAATQLDLFSETRFLKYPDGTLVQIAGEPAIYLIEGGKKRGLSMSEKQFLKLGFDASKVKQVTVDELIGYPVGLLIKYGPDGQLVGDGAKVYFIENGKKRWVTSQNLFNALGYKWSKIKKLAPEEVATYLEGGVMLYPDGTLLRQIEGQTVYLMKDGKKHEFLSAQSFLKLGYKWGKIKAVEVFEIALCPSGDFIPYADGTLVQVQGSPTVFLVEKSKIRPFLTAEIFLARGYKWSQILTVSSQELSYYQQGQFVGYPEGWLVRSDDRNNVYLISGGAPQVIDAATFAKRKYKWANVKVVPAQDFGIIYEGKSISVSLPIPSPSPTPAPSLSPTPTPSVTPAIPSPSPSIMPSPTPTENPSAATEPKIRVAIFEVTSSSVTLTADGNFDILNKTGQILVSKNAGENFVYTIEASDKSYAKIVPKSSNGIVEIVSYEDRPAWKPTLNYNKFRGAVEIVYSAKSNKVWAVNELNLEDYLRGNGEILQDDPVEHQKTMAVAARSYAYYYILKGGKYGADEVYHLKNTSADQLYKGYARETVASTVVAAVEVTKGGIVMFNGQPIVAAYSSGAPELQTTGTKSACVVWGGAYCQAGYEYLSGGVKDPSGATYTQTSCGGANHCVGISAAGSRQFAKTGAKNYQEILKYYYPGTVVQKIY